MQNRYRGFAVAHAWCYPVVYKYGALHRGSMVRSKSLTSITFYVKPKELKHFRKLAAESEVTLSMVIRSLLKLPRIERGAPKPRGSGKKKRAKKKRIA